MAFSLFSVVSLTVIYRITINFPELPYTNELKNVESDEFLNTAKDISNSIQSLLKEIHGQHSTRVIDFRYHNVIGSLAEVEVYTDKESPRVSDIILSAIKKGYIGKLKVSDEGFELHVVRDSETSCATTEFTCLDKTCIAADQRCDGRRDCPDGSDEHKEHALCKQHQPIIHQSQKIVFVPRHGIVHLAAAIDSTVNHTQVAWSKDSVLLGVGSVRLVDDDRFDFYQKSEKHYLRITNATQSDEGKYKMIIQGMNVEADFDVVITNDDIVSESDDCPVGEKACKSGHCLPVSQFCDRRVQCPDGDDEQGCSEVECKSNEFRCESTNVCVPSVVICDGWRDCHDGSDEKNCTTSKKTYKPHHHVKLNVLCQDGSQPEFSLHGSSYCWTNKVCPAMTECIHGLCCSVAKTGKRQTSQCQANEFHCNSGECIEESLKCNRKYDCADGSDETTCEYYIAVQKYHAEQRKQQSETPSQPEQHQSHPAHPQQQHHAATQPSPVPVPAPVAAPVHDEGLCSDQEFRCPYLPETKCFHYDKLCDGHDDCGDGSDETNCDSNEDDGKSNQAAATGPATSSRCSEHQFECKRDSRCIDKSLECNRKYDCDDGSDETECEYFKTAMARREETTSAAAVEQPHQQQHHQQQQHQQQEQQQRHPAQPDRRQEQEEHRRREDEERRRHEEHRQRLEQQRQEHERREQSQRSQVRQQLEQDAHQPISTEVTFHDEYDNDSGAGCLEHEFQCAIGECIDKRRVCDTRPDCLDASDEQNCADRAPARSDNEYSPQTHHSRLPSPPQTQPDYPG